MASSFISFYRHFKLLICLTILIFDYCASVPIHHHLQPKYHHHRNRRHSPENERNSIRIPSSLCQGESFPLGMESGDIGDEQLTASSSYNLQSVGPQNARLNREISGGAWCPNKQLSAAHSGSEWIQVDLQDFYVITAIATQGRFGNGLGVEFAEEFWIEYSRDNGTTWNKWTDMNGDYYLLCLDSSVVIFINQNIQSNHSNNGIVRNANNKLLLNDYLISRSRAKRIFLPHGLVNSR